MDIEETRKELEKLAKHNNLYRKTNDPLSKEMSGEEIVQEFVNVANETMCRTIRKLIEMKGHETKHKYSDRRKSFWYWIYKYLKAKSHRKFFW